MRSFASSTRLLLIALPVALLVAATILIVRTQHTLTQASRTDARAHQVPFTLAAFHPPADRGFEPVAAAQHFTCGIQFRGSLYLAGPSGLAIHEPDGTLTRTLRPGLELPTAPITAITSARLRNALEPQLLLATAGAGLLLLTPQPFAITQLLPAAAEQADLTSLLALPSGDLLLGTRHHGLLTFDGSVLEATPIPATDITALAAPLPGALLVGTRTQGLFYAHAGTVTTIQSLPDPDIEAIATTASTAYIGTPRGIAQLDLASATVARILGPDLFAHTLALTPSSLEVGTLDQGVVTLPLTPRLRPASITAPATPDTRRIDAFLTPADVLPRDIHPANTLTDANISALAFTPSGSLYIGFFDHGLDILDPTANTLRHLEDDHLFCINRLLLDPVQHTIAAATANGLVLFDTLGNPRQTLTRRDGLLADHVTDLAFTPTGRVIATPAGLTFLTANGPQSIYAFQGLVNNHVYTLAGSGTELLAGTLGGLSILQGDRVLRNATVTNSTLRHNWITALAPTTPGSYIVGTYGAALETLSRDGVFTPIDLPAGTPRDLVINPNALLVTPTHIFAGTLGHGMLVYTVATGRWRTITSGLPSLNVTAFAAHAGTLYIGTENGLVRIPEPAL